MEILSAPEALLETDRIGPYRVEVKLNVTTNGSGAAENLNKRTASLRVVAVE
jgi:hypothetical protein